MNKSERVAAKLEELVRYAVELKQHQNLAWENFTEQVMLRRGIERTLQLAIECMLDIGNALVAANHWRAPQTNRDIFKILAEEGVVEKGFLEELEQMAGFRNVLVHEYTHVDPEIVFGILKKRLGSFERYVLAIRKFLNTSGT